MYAHRPHRSTAARLRSSARPPRSSSLTAPGGARSSTPARLTSASASSPAAGWSTRRWVRVCGGLYATHVRTTRVCACVYVCVWLYGTHKGVVHGHGCICMGLNRLPAHAIATASAATEGDCAVCSCMHATPTCTSAAAAAAPHMMAISCLAHIFLHPCCCRRCPADDGHHQALCARGLHGSGLLHAAVWRRTARAP